MSRARADQPQAPSPAKDLVLLHGWGMNAGVWEGLPEAATPQLRLHLIELPGHGGQPVPLPRDPGPGALDAWADACLDSAPAGAVWLGWSLGGLVALAAALRTTKGPHGRVGGQIRGLVLMTATPRFVRAPDWPAAMPPETLAQFHDGLLGDPGATLSRFLALQVRGSDQGRQTLRRLRQDLAARPPPDPAALSLGLALLRGQDLRPHLRRLRLPTLWIFGSRDTLVPAEVAPQIPSLLPGARACVIPGAGHAPFLSHPAETWGAVAAFLSAPLARGAGTEGHCIEPDEPDSAPEVQASEPGPSARVHSSIKTAP